MPNKIEYTSAVIMMSILTMYTEVKYEILNHLDHVSRVMLAGVSRDYHACVLELYPDTTRRINVCDIECSPDLLGYIYTMYESIVSYKSSIVRAILADRYDILRPMIAQHYLRDSTFNAVISNLPMDTGNYTITQIIMRGRVTICSFGYCQSCLRLLNSTPTCTNLAYYVFADENRLFQFLDKMASGHFDSVMIDGVPTPDAGRAIFDIAASKFKYSLTMLGSVSYIHAKYGSRVINSILDMYPCSMYTLGLRCSPKMSPEDIKEIDADHHTIDIRGLIWDRDVCMKYRGVPTRISAKTKPEHIRYLLDIALSESDADLSLLAIHAAHTKNARLLTCIWDCDWAPSHDTVVLMLGWAAPDMRKEIVSAYYDPSMLSDLIDLCIRIQNYSVLYSVGIRDDIPAYIDVYFGLGPIFLCARDYAEDTPEWIAALYTEVISRGRYTKIPRLYDCMGLPQSRVPVSADLLAAVACRPRLYDHLLGWA